MILSADDLYLVGNVSENLETGCWIWGGSFTHNGYGRIGDKRAHRLSWSFENGPIPEGLLVLHSCDTPPCIRPSHLFVGTQLDNMQDMIAKGRKVTVRGEDHTSKSQKYRDGMSGDNHWTKRHPERIASGSRHWSKLHPEKFAEHLRRINEAKKKG